MLLQLLLLLPSSLCYLLHQHVAANTTSDTDCYGYCHCNCCQLIVAFKFLPSIAAFLHLLLWCHLFMLLWLPLPVLHPAPQYCQHHWCCCLLLSFPFVIIASCQLIVAALYLYYLWLQQHCQGCSHCLLLPWMSLLPCCTVGQCHEIGTCCHWNDCYCLFFLCCGSQYHCDYTAASVFLSYLFCLLHLDLVEDTIITTSNCLL